jgi:hypothetical protein
MALNHHPPFASISDVPHYSVSSITVRASIFQPQENANASAVGTSGVPEHAIRALEPTSRPEELLNVPLRLTRRWENEKKLSRVALRSTPVYEVSAANVPRAWH